MAASQEFSIVYGSLTVGGSNYPTYKLQGPFTYTEAYPEGSLSQLVVVTGATEAAFVANCQALVAAYRIPYQRLQIVQGSTTMRDWNPSTDSGFNAAPSCEKVADDSATGRSRTYRISVRFGLPADLSGRGGRQSSTTSVAYDASDKRTVTISGRYTSIGGAGARATYTTGSPTFFSGVKTALGITAWEQVGAPIVATDDTDKLCDFNVVFREIYYDQSDAGLDHANIVGHSVVFKQQASGAGGSASYVQPLEVWDCAYSCNVKGEPDVEGLWTDTIRPYLMSEFLRISGISSYGITMASPAHVYAGPSGPMIVGALQFTGQGRGAGGVFEYSESDGFDEEGGLIFTKPWDGDLHSNYVDQGQATILRVIQRMTKSVGTFGATRRIPGGLGADWHMIHNTSSATPLYIGLPGKQVVATKLDETLVFRLATKPKGASAVTTPSGDEPPTSGGDSGGAPTTPSDPGSSSSTSPPQITPPTPSGGSPPVGGGQSAPNIRPPGGYTFDTPWRSR